MDSKTSNKKLCSKIPYERAEDSGNGCTQNHGSKFVFQYRVGFFAVLFSTLLVGCFCMVVVYFNMYREPCSESAKMEGAFPQSPFITFGVDPETRAAVIEMASDNEIFVPNIPFPDFTEEEVTKRQKRQINKPKDCKKECAQIIKAVEEVSHSMNSQLEELRNYLIEQNLLNANDPREVNYQTILDCLQCGNSIDHKEEDEVDVTRKVARQSGSHISEVLPFFDNQHSAEDKVDSEEALPNGDERTERGLTKQVMESVTNSSKTSDGSTITEILHNTTIVEKDPGGSNNNRGQIFHHRPVNMQSIGTRGGESHVTRTMQGAVTPTAETTMYQQFPSRQPSAADVPSAIHPFILPTAESTKYSQQIQYTPQAAAAPGNPPLIPVCFYSNPPSPSGAPQPPQQPFFFPYSAPPTQGPPQPSQQIKFFAPNGQPIFQSQLPAQFFQSSGLQGTTPFPSPFPAANQPLPPRNAPYYCTYVQAPTVAPQQQPAFPPPMPAMSGYQNPFLARADSNNEGKVVSEQQQTVVKSTYDEDDDRYFFDKCNGYICPPPYRKCIPHHQRCDGKVDCIGAEDEIDCPIVEDTYYSRFMPAVVAPTRSEQSIVEDMTKTITTYIATTNSPMIVETTEYNDVETTTMKIIVPDLPKQFKCKRIIQTVSLSKRCNGVFDCEDASDEEGCTCKDYLALRRPSAVCDGYVDCSDGTDEEECNFCRDNEYHCHRSGGCIPRNKVCNQMNDCKLNEDELDCFVLTDGKHVNLDVDKRPHLNRAGVLTRYENGAWRPSCYKSELRNDGKRVTAAQRICEYLGFRNVDNVHEVIVEKSKLEERTATRDHPIGYEYPPQFTPMARGDNNTCYGLYIRCKPIIDSKVNIHVNVNPANQERRYVWPWEGSVFADGKYQCPAVLLENNLLLASSKCARDIDLRNNYTTAVFGVSSPEIPYSGPYQQTSQVVDIRPIKNSDASLFRLKDNVNMTRYVQPIYLEKRIFPAAKNDSCVALGVTEDGRRKMKFVHPVVDDCSICHRCYFDKNEATCSRANETMSWSGNIVCLSGTGGWYPTAVFQDKDENCGFNKKQTLNGIDYIHAHLSEAIDEHVPNIIEPTCDGVRCGTGQCVPWSRVCDGVRDCADGADESHETCSDYNKRCDENTANCKCSQAELRCGNGKCVPKEKFCDGRIDCADGSDEPATCTCAEYLKLTRPKLVCDNRRHCLDKTDEDYRYCHCKDNSFKCDKSSVNGTVACITPDVVCDGHPDCPEGEDEYETTCNGIKSGLADPHGKGELQRRSYGVWHSACWPEPARTQAQVQTACQKMGFRTGIFLDSKQTESTYVPRNDFYMFQTNNHTWLTMREDQSFGVWVRPTMPCYKIFLQCF